MNGNGDLPGSKNEIRNFHGAFFVVDCWHFLAPLLKIELLLLIAMVPEMI
jgi:hypothetical protein